MPLTARSSRAWRVYALFVGGPLLLISGLATLVLLIACAFGSPGDQAGLHVALSATVAIVSGGLLVWALH
jgi:hypothetical protein